ncbi:ubiquitin carboxyl-terminal hydrolase-related protein [Actinidia rufa]|uniref:Ubiquitin carboxyl-terminal hydrolase-related protein n=1 Tax=Actinidia rufa TaxID=165716 RepID=A0A7J0F2J0_9ERIC|nr:ubiquitin carboxyl-terminal hydrolase-related protein [Actinidia rufa]
MRESPKALRRGTHTKALRLMKEMSAKHENSTHSALIHRVQGTVCVKVASIIDDLNAKQRHLKNAIESATKAVSLSPNSVEFAHFYANLLYEAANDGKMRFGCLLRIEHSFDFDLDEESWECGRENLVSSFHARLEDLAEEDATEKSDAARELALDSRKGSGGGPVDSDSAARFFQILPGLESGFIHCLIYEYEEFLTFFVLGTRWSSYSVEGYKVLEEKLELSNSCGIGRYSDKSIPVNDSNTGTQGSEITDKLIVLFDDDALSSWMFTGPTIGEQLALWTRMREEKVQEGMEICETLKKEFYHLQLYKRKCEHLSYKDAVQAVDDLHLEEGKKMAHVTEFVRRSYESVLQKGTNLSVSVTPPSGLLYRSCNPETERAVGHRVSSFHARLEDLAEEDATEKSDTARVVDVVFRHHLLKNI